MVWKRWSQNLGAKSLALFAAVALWVSVTNGIEFEKTLTFPIEYVNVPDNLTPVRELPDEARAKIRARGKFLSVRLRDGVCRVDLSRQGPGVANVAVDGANLVLPGDVPVLQKDVIEPRLIGMEFDELVTRDIAIRADVSGQPHPRYLRVGPATVSPEKVRVSGPRKLVDEIALVDTEPVDIEGDKAPFRKRVRLVPPGPVTVSYSPTVVDVGVMIEEQVDQALEGIELRLAGAVPDTLRPEFRPGNLSIEITGARSLVDVAAGNARTLTLRADSAAVWRPGNAVLRLKEFRGSDIVFALARPAPAEGADSAAAPPPSAAPGVLAGTLTLPEGVRIRGVKPERIVLAIAGPPAPAPPEPQPDLTQGKPEGGSP